MGPDIVEQAFLEMHYADHLREAAGRDYHRSQELPTARQSVRRSMKRLADVGRGLICAVALLQERPFCAVPA